ncbi:MAG: hypothetical protein WBG90_08230 [Saonia sp.]
MNGTKSYLPLQETYVTLVDSGPFFLSTIYDMGRLMIQARGE